MAGITIHGVIGLLVIVYVILAFIFDFARKKSKSLDEKLNNISPSKLVPDKIKWWFMALFAIANIFLYLYCWICKITENDGGDDALYLDFIFRDLLGILPWFVWGCILAGVVMKYLKLGRLRLPSTMMGAGLFASILPICSCAAVPMAHGMMLGKQMRVRAIITFLIVVPVLSPVVYILAIGEQMYVYLIVEIIAVFVLAILTGMFVERFAGKKEAGDQRSGCYSCDGCKSVEMGKGNESALLASWDHFMYLLKYILFGIIIGAAIATFAEPSHLADLFGSQTDFYGSIPGLVLIVCIAIPIFICSGEEVLILAPLLALGLPLGHAVAFAIAGNAICITAAPVLNATFGKKVTVLLFAAFFVGSIAIGLTINGIIWMVG